MWKVFYITILALIFTKSSVVLGEERGKVSVSELADKIQVLDDTLYTTITSLPIGCGAQFLADVRSFNELLRQMVEMVYADKNGTKAALDTIITRGHPRFLDTPFNNEEKKRILDNFNWTLDDLDLLYADRITAYTYWTDLLLLKNDDFQREP